MFHKLRADGTALSKLVRLPGGFLGGDKKVLLTPAKDGPLGVGVMSASRKREKTMPLKRKQGSRVLLQNPAARTLCSVSMVSDNTLCRAGWHHFRCRSISSDENVITMARASRFQRGIKRNVVLTRCKPAILLLRQHTTLLGEKTSVCYSHL